MQGHMGNNHSTSYALAGWGLNGDPPPPMSLLVESQRSRQQNEHHTAQHQPLKFTLALVPQQHHLNK
jgi:hypothetical protein